MQTEKLYEQDATLRVFEATVLACEPYGARFRVALDRTAFFPEGGGQPADQGTLGEAHVLDAHARDGVVWHEVDRALQPGARVQGLVDDARRMDFTQQHSGEHIVSGIVHRLYGYDNVGFHIGSGAVTLDFNGELAASDLARVERMANEAVWRDLPVRAYYPDAEALAHLAYRSKKEIDGALRIVEVPGCDVCACCGTHVQRTGEIGLIKVVDCIRYKGGVRVSILCGARALQDACDKHDSVRQIGAMLCAKSAEVAQGVRRLMDERDALKAQLDAVWGRVFTDLAAQTPEGAPLAVAFLPDLAPAQVRRLASALAERAQVGAAFSPDGDGCRFALCARDADVRPAGKALLGALGGRGGGPRDMVQGSVACADEEAIRAALDAALRAECGR